MHRSLTRAFVTGPEQIPPRFLWRLEAGRAWSDPVVLVQSAQAADWAVLETPPNYLKRKAETKNLNLAQLLHAGARYRFRLVANPTVTRDGKRYGLVSDDAQLAWLERQGRRFGFELKAALVSSSDVLKSNRSGMLISLQSVCFEGILQAQNRETLSDALRGGIGPGKAFGCGLLSLAHC